MMAPSVRMIAIYHTELRAFSPRFVWILICCCCFFFFCIIQVTLEWLLLSSYGELFPFSGSSPPIKSMKPSPIPHFRFFLNVYLCRARLILSGGYLHSQYIPLMRCWLINRRMGNHSDGARTGSRAGKSRAGKVAGNPAGNHSRNRRSPRSRRTRTGAAPYRPDPPPKWPMPLPWRRAGSRQMAPEPRSSQLPPPPALSAQISFRSFKFPMRLPSIQLRSVFYEINSSSVGGTKTNN